MFWKLSRFHQILHSDDPVQNLKNWPFRRFENSVPYGMVHTIGSISSTVVFLDRLVSSLTVHFWTPKLGIIPKTALYYYISRKAYSGKSELRFFGLAKDLTFRFQFWNAGIIKIIGAKYQWLQIFQIDYLTFQQFTSRIIGYSMTSEIFEDKKVVQLTMILTKGPERSGRTIRTRPAISICRCGQKF